MKKPGGSSAGGIGKERFYYGREQKLNGREQKLTGYSQTPALCGHRRLGHVPDGGDPPPQGLCDHRQRHQRVRHARAHPRLRHPGQHGPRAENIGDAELVVYTAAAKQDNPELVAAREKGVPTLERSVVLGLLTKKFSNSIAVSGTHGKTTTTGMLTQILIEAGRDPERRHRRQTALHRRQRPRRQERHHGLRGLRVRRHLPAAAPRVQHHPDIDGDHLDYFGTLDNIIKSFHQFCLQTSGCILVNGDNENAMRAVAGITHAKVLTFGRSASCDYCVSELNEEDTACEDFTIMHGDERVCRVNLHVPGEHNMMNALAAAAAAHYFGVDGAHIKTALEAIHRRAPPL